MAAQHHGVQVRLLGPVRAWRDGIELSLGSARRQAVFSVLALHANQAVSREELINAVWGDDPPASALGNVYTYISALRQILEPERDRACGARLLTSGGGSYRLHVDEADVDALHFETLREESRQHRAAGNQHAELGAIHSALELWQDMWYGEALAGIPGPYADAKRLRLGELRLASLERHAALMLDLGRHVDVVPGLRNLVARYPLRENLHALLMTALHRAGRRAEALDVHRNLRELLLEEAGTEPSEALRAVHDQILAGTTTSEPAVAEPAPGSPTDLFIGREPQVERLRRAVTDVAAGVGGSLWIEGEPGIGKSTLMAEGLRAAEAVGCMVGWGIGDELAQRMPLSVLLECFDLRGCIADGADPDTSELVRSLIAAAGDTSVDPTAAVLEGAVALVERACAQSPLVLVVDDMQWADDITLLVWRSLHQLTQRMPLLLVAAARPLPRTRQLNVLRRVLAEQDVELMALQPLDPTDAGDLVRKLHPALDAAAVDRIVTGAAGNPYYLRHLAATGGTDEPGPPPALISTVGAHLDLLTEETRHILRAIAFLGDDSSISEIAAVTGRPAPELIRAVEEALAAGFLAETERRLTFRHPVVRRVLHDGTPTALRVMLHRAFAEKIAHLGGDPERVVAQLLAGPVPLDGWVGGWLAEHADALATRAPETAVTILRYATAPSNLDPLIRETLAACLARLLFSHGQPADAEARWVAARTTDADLAAEMWWIIAVAHHRRGEDTAAAEVVRTVLRDDGVPLHWLDRFQVLLTRLTPHVPTHRTTDVAAAAARRDSPVPRQWRRGTSTGNISVIH